MPTQVMVSYAADPSAVYLRLTDQYELVQRMEEELNKSVVSPATPAGFRGLETGQLCAALFEGRWYRGDVRTVEDSHYVIHFIDWGNSERVPPTGVTQLPASLQDVPPQAVLAVLPWRPAGPGGDWSDAQWEGLAALNGQPLTASVTGTEPSVRVALFNADGKSVLSVMADSVRTAGGPETQTQTQEWTVPPQVELEVDRKHVVVPCAMVHPQLVSAQVRDLALYRAYQAIVEQLQTAANAESPLSAVPPEGCPVLVNCPGPLGDGPAWRRAVVQGRHGDRAVVRLLDWGRLETAGLAQLRRLPPHLCETPSIGVQFGLFGVPESACPEDQLRFFREKLIGKEFLLERVESSDARTQARLHLLSDTNSFCFNDKMLGRVSDAARVARPAALSAVSAVSPPTVASPQKRCRLGSESNAGRPPLLSDLANPSLRPGDTHPFLLGQVLGPGRFLGGPLTDENTAAVDRLEEELREAMTGQTAPLPIRQPPQAGQLVAVRGVEDAGAAGWARGAVADPFGPQALVRLLDMGRQERVALDRLYQLPDQVSRLPPTSLLLAFRGSERWSAEQRQRAEEVLRGDGSGEEQVLDLTVVSVGSAGAAVLVTCPQLEVC
ncbi:Tudor domain-containing protein 1 [Amphibalanus amphitrite]|uniref:Tudor domain-containing protein 1 n=1 Tax=Amphibalanus amphitrite TaxID=1232801 RepID=A0A6A4VEV8_AMPAM|nr:Tudor domain-containing protein 1 [Amphibalanus amphitrite]